VLFVVCRFLENGIVGNFCIWLAVIKILRQTRIRLSSSQRLFVYIIFSPLFLLGLIFCVSLFVYLVAVKKLGLLMALAIVLLVILPFFYDIVLTRLFAFYYCKIAPPHPKTDILKVDDYPMSIYWDDRIYPGFSREDRIQMIANYLDGRHLKLMVLNDPDGQRVHIYRVDKPILDSFKKRDKDWWREYAEYVMRTEEVRQRSDAPRTNYTIVSEEVPLPAIVKKFLYADETRVVENATKKVVAYNRRYMRFFYRMFPDTEVGGRFYYPHALCGKRVAHLEYKVFHAYEWTGIHLGNHARNLHDILLKRSKSKQGDK